MLRDRSTDACSHVKSLVEEKLASVRVNVGSWTMLHIRMGESRLSETETSARMVAGGIERRMSGASGNGRVSELASGWAFLNMGKHTLRNAVRGLGRSDNLTAVASFGASHATEYIDSRPGRRVSNWRSPDYFRPHSDPAPTLSPSRSRDLTERSKAFSST